MWLPSNPHWPNAAPRHGDRNVLAYGWRVAGLHLAMASLIAVLLAAITLAPIDLERRIIDHITEGGTYEQIVALGILYLLFNLLQQFLKAMLGMLQDWLTAALTANCRRDLTGFSTTLKRSAIGQKVEVLTAETDHLAQFVGTGFSAAAADLLVLAGIVGWMIFIERDIAVLSLMVFIPQIVFAIFIQHFLNRLNEQRVRLMRKYASSVAANRLETVAQQVEQIASNQFKIGILQQLNKAVRNVMIALPVMLIFIYGGWLVIQGSTTIGTVVAFASGYRKLSDPLRGLLDFYVDFQKAQVQFKLLAQWFNENGAPEPSPAPSKTGVRNKSARRAK